MSHVVTMVAVDEAPPFRRMLEPGDLVKDFRGDWWTFDGPVSPTVPGKSGRVQVSDRGDRRTFYADVFGLTVHGLMSCGCPVGPLDPGHLDDCTEA